jgi:hypothetical protein
LRALGSPETTVQITLAQPCPAALEALRALDGVTASTLLTDGPEGAALPSLVYRTHRPTEINPRVIELLVAGGARIVSVTCAARSLEDVYAAAVAAGEN